MTWAAKQASKRGRQRVCSDAAVQTCLTMKGLFGMAQRQTTGFVKRLLSLIGRDGQVPDFSTLSRRQRTRAVTLPHRGSQSPLRPLIDTTGIKGEGEGGWNAGKHGGTKRRVGRKAHLRIDEETLEVRAVEVTRSDTGDAPMLPDLLAPISTDQNSAGVTADSANDTRKGHDAIADRGAAAIIAPRKNAKPSRTVTAGAIARN
jgi:Transposase DDE domain